MTDQGRAVLREALALADDERAAVAAELLASLDDPVAVQREWAPEIGQRAQRELSEEAIGWSELRGRVLRKFASE